MSVRLVCLPDGSGDGRRIGSWVCGLNLAGRRCGGKRTAQQFVQPLGMNFTAEKIGFNQNAAAKPAVGLDASAGVFVEGSPNARNGFLAACAPGKALAL